MSILEARDLFKSYGAVNALNGMTLSLDKGKIVGLLGPNGSGKTTFIKIATGLISRYSGEILISGRKPGYETKEMVAYLPDRNSLPPYMNASELLRMHEDFFANFSRRKAEQMLFDLNINMKQPLKAMSKGTIEKVQLVLVMSRNADLYLLDEPIGGVDPAARDYILRTIIGNYNEDALVLISTHLISDIEHVLDDVLFMRSGEIIMHKDSEAIREEYGMSVDELFREVFKC